MDELILTAPTAAAAAQVQSRPRTYLIKTHECSVTYPDGTSGACRYERLGPACHRFGFGYHDGAFIARLYWTYPLQNDPETIEEAGRNHAEEAFGEAIERERKDYFARATEPTDGSRKAIPAKFRLAAGKAKEVGGRYALCLHVGTTLIPCTSTFQTLGEANAAWIEKGNPTLYVACCNRLDRCWELPRYNPLYKKHPELKEGKPKPCHQQPS